MKPLIAFESLSKIYQMGETQVRAVDGISMEIMPGEFVAIVGQSGSGKSTCMNIIGCLDIPTSGKYYLDGHDVGKLDDDELAVIRNKMIGFIFQQYNLLPKLSVLGNVELPLQYAGMAKHERHERAKLAIEKVGLTDKLNNLPSQLSGGQQQRVSVARALATNPSVILADEPTGALDSKTGEEVIGLLKKLHAEGNTVVLITHDNAIASQAQRIIRLQDGHIIYNGLPNDKVITTHEDVPVEVEESAVEVVDVTKAEETTESFEAADVTEEANSTKSVESVEAAVEIKPVEATEQEVMNP